MTRLRPRFPVALAALSLLAVGLSGCSHIADVKIIARNFTQAEIELFVTIESVEGEGAYSHKFKLVPFEYQLPEESYTDKVLLKPGTYIFRASTGEFHEETTEQVSGGDYRVKVNIRSDRMELVVSPLYTD